MGRIGIIGAMEIEVAALREEMVNKNCITVAGMNFYCGTFHQKEIVLVKSGVGKVNAAICTQLLVDRFDVSALINTGVAGSLCAEINIGDIVISSDALSHDMDASIFGYAPGTIPQMAISDFQADPTLIELARTSCAQVNPDIQTHVGRIVSGDQFISGSQKKEELRQTFHALCTEMEGAAIAQTAYLNQIPFVILRAISDKADGSASMDYNLFEKQAALRSMHLVAEMLSHISA